MKIDVFFLRVEEDNEPEGPELPELEDKVSITDTTQEEFSCVKVSKSDSEEVCCKG